MKTQIGKTKTFGQIAHGAAVTHKVVNALGKTVGLHGNERDAKAHANVLNADIPGAYSVKPITA
jgi:hypothetical protein